MDKENTGWKHARDECDAHLTIVIITIEESIPSLGSEGHDMDDSEPNADRWKVGVEAVKW